MSKFTKEEITRLADLLMIGLTDEEADAVLEEFDFIDQNIHKVAEIPNIEKVEPMTHALDDFTFSLRDDVVEDSVAREELLANCDDVSDGAVSVPKVVG